jgi:NTP pyrophosphatase (non-canonical NTP hydrolase)
MMNRSVNDLLAMIENMRNAHQWQITDTPNVLAKSIVVESNELLECFLNDDFDVELVKSELADVLMYALSLAKDLNLDLYDLIYDKIQDVNQRYQ